MKCILTIYDKEKFDRKLASVKFIKKVTLLGLKESKDIFDEYMCNDSKSLILTVTNNFELLEEAKKDLYQLTDYKININYTDRIYKFIKLGIVKDRKRLLNVIDNFDPSLVLEKVLEVLSDDEILNITKKLIDDEIL